MRKTFLILLIALTAGILAGIFVPVRYINPYLPFIAKPRQIIGFQPYWLVEKANTEYAEYITTFGYFSLTITDEGKIKKQVNDQEQEPGWTTLNLANFEKLLEKTKSNNGKLSLVIQNFDEEEIQKLIATPEKSAKTIVEEVTPIMQKYGFTDLNIDIESHIEQKDQARNNFKKFIQEIHKGVTENQLGTLTIDIAAESLVKKQLINLQAVAPYIDYVVLMTYDYHYISSTRAGPVAPIGGAGTVREYDVDTTIKEALKIMPKEKIILGIPTYGYEWEALTEKPGAPIIPGSGKTASHKRVEKLLAECKDCKRVVDPHSLEPYIIYPSTDSNYWNQLFYEDEESMKRKILLTEKYDIGGIAVWALGYEGEGMLNVLREYRKTVQ